MDTESLYLGGVIRSFPPRYKYYLQQFISRRRNNFGRVWEAFVSRATKMGKCNVAEEDWCRRLGLFLDLSLPLAKEEIITPLFFKQLLLILALGRNMVISDDIKEPTGPRGLSAQCCEMVMDESLFMIHNVILHDTLRHYTQTCAECPQERERGSLICLDCIEKARVVMTPKQLEHNQKLFHFFHKLKQYKIFGTLPSPDQPSQDPCRVEEAQHLNLESSGDIEAVDVRPCQVGESDNRKCMQLRDKCLKADQILNELLANGMGISRESIMNINRDGHLLPEKFTHQHSCMMEIEHEIKVENDNDEVSENYTDVVPTHDYSETEYEETNSDAGSNNCEVKIEIEENELIDIYKGDNTIVDTTPHNYTTQKAISDLNETAVKTEICEADNCSKLDVTLQNNTVENCDPATNKPDSTKEKTYKFEMCDYKCSVNLIRHVRTHTGEKSHGCEMCDYKCDRKHDLVRHVRTHTGEKPYTGEKSHGCEMCDYKCDRKHDLVRHVRTHTGEKPYNCEFCDYKCDRKSNLIRHVRTHTGEKPYKCEMCDFRCINRCNLVKHIRKHTGEKPYKCEICDFRCIDRCNLVKHIKKHTGEKPYKCEICDFRCIDRCDLVKHIRKHTGEKPYKCELCIKKFSLKHDLVRPQTSYKIADMTLLHAHIG